MASVYISVGGNIEPERHVVACVRDLAQTLEAVRISPVYRNQAVGFQGEDFLNLVLVARTARPVRALIALLREVEVRHGRRRDAPKFSPRTADLDLLLYDDLILESGGLVLPRDEITRYAFVLKPLADLAPDGRHPISGRRYADLWAGFDPNAPALTEVAVPELDDLRASP